MDQYTTELLEKYEDNIFTIDLSERKINNLLNLAKFKNLSVLICSHNKITDLSNLPNLLCKLDCSCNEIIELEPAVSTNSLHVK